MKKILSTITMLVALMLSNAASAQELNEIVAKHIEAIGGAQNWSKVKSMATEMTMKAQGADIKVNIRQIHKKGMRVDIQVMGMNGYQILTDKEGWGYMPFGGQTKAEPLTPDDVKTSQDELDLQDEFLTYKDYGKTIEYLGKDDMEGTECHKISLTDKEGMMTTFYLDGSNYQVLKQVSKKKANGKEFESTTTYSNYKKVDGDVVVAMAQSGDEGDLEITKVEINPIIDESIFQAKSLEELKK